MRVGRRGGALGDAGSGNPGRRPRVPASIYNLILYRWKRFNYEYISVRIAMNCTYSQIHSRLQGA